MSNNLEHLTRIAAEQGETPATVLLESEIPTEKQESELQQMETLMCTMREYGVPVHDHMGLARWVLFGVMPGSFLKAVLCNDLMTACSRADIYNKHAMFEVVQWLYNHAPAECWGTPEKVDAWVLTKVRA